MFDRASQANCLTIVMGRLQLKLGCMRRAAFAGFIAATCMLFLGSDKASAAHTSVACPAKSATVVAGGTVTINVTDCTPLGIGFAGIGPVDGPAFPAHGGANLRITGSNWFLDYSHNGDTATSDYFEFTDATVAGNTVGVAITIAASSSPIAVSPGSLPVMAAGAAFSQALTSTGGVGSYTYSLQSGVLPPGLSLSSGGVLSGTPTQRGAYTFSIRSTDSKTPTAQFSDKGYTGTVANPTLSISPAAPTAIQGVAFSQALTASGGVAPYTYLLETGSFPAGISISSAGVVSGTTNAATGNYAVTLRVTDSSTGPGSYFELENFTLTVSPPPSVSIAVSPASVAEDGATNLVYTVTRSLNLSSPTVVNITTSGTAASGTDYTGAAATVTIPAGATTATVTINPTADTTVEADETVTLTIAAGAGYTVGTPSSATGTILNDDLPTLTINDVTASEGNAGTTNFTFTVSLSSPAGAGGVTFDIATANGTASAGSDYVAQSLTAQNIPSGSGSYTFTVQVNGDLLSEANETFFVNVTNVSGAIVGDGQGLGTIINDDAPPSISTSNVSVTEGNSGTVNAVVTVTLSAASGQTVTVNYATADGSATAPSDYTAASGSLTFAPGQTSRTITILVNGDTTPEANETFTVGLSGATNATIGVATSVVTITNDDVPVVLVPNTLPSGAYGSAYSQTITASGGTAPYSFAVTAGSLPGGLTLTAGGLLSGTPNAIGSFNFTVSATDSSGAPGPYTGSALYSTVIGQGTQATLVASSAAFTLTFGGTTTLSATGGSGTGAVTYSSSNANCIIVGSTLTAAGTGTCIVTATKAADANYLAATSAGISVTVTQAAQAALVASSALSTVAFGTTSTLSTTGGSGTGAVTFTSNNANCSIAGATLTAAAVGTCIVTATKAGDSNYTSATSPGITVTVAQATQATLVAVSTPSTVAFGGTTALSATGGSGTGALTFSSSNANCTIVGTTLTTAAVGTCLVTATKAADANYAAATSSGITLTITQAPQAALVASSSVATVTFGGTAVLSAAGGSGSGAVTFASSNGNCTIVGTTLTAAAVGTCTITATKAGDTNYSAVSSLGVTVTVTQAMQVLAFNPVSSVLTISSPLTMVATGGGSGNPVIFASLTPAVCISGGVNGATITLTGAAGNCTVRATQAGNANYSAASPLTRTISVVLPAPPVTPPSVPTDFTCTVATRTSIGCRFGASSDGEGNAVQGYQLVCATETGTATQLTISANTTSAVFEGLTAGRYTCSAKAIGSVFDSDQSSSSLVALTGINLALRNHIDIDGSGLAQILLRGPSESGASVKVSQIGRFDSATQKFLFTPISDPGEGWVVLGAGDIKGNQRTYVISRNSTDDVKVSRNGEHFVLRRAKQDWLVDAVNDLDGDGRADITWRYLKPGTDDSGVIFSWYVGADSAIGARIDEVRRRGGAPLNWSVVGGIDLDGDGRGDIVWQSPAGELRGTISNADRTWTNSKIGQVPSGYSVVKLGDFDGDGKGDVFFRNAQGQVKLWKMNGFTILAEIDMPSIEPNWVFYAAGDFDGNGTMDVVWRRPDNSLVLWKMGRSVQQRVTVIANAGIAPTGMASIEP